MRTFNLEEAKEGNPVCTGNGKDVRIICFNAKSWFPIIGLITNHRDQDEIVSFTIEGKNDTYSPRVYMEASLFMKN